MTQQRQRLLSLDILRGITIAAMIIVNNPGSWSNMYEPLDHAEWSGVTPTDFIFPFFMFIMGVSMCFSLKKYDYKLTSQSFAKVCRRGIGIYLVGIAIGMITEFYTSGDYSAVKKIASQTTTGSATTVISGIAVGMRSTAIPILLICVPARVDGVDLSFPMAFKVLFRLVPARVGGVDLSNRIFTQDDAYLMSPPVWAGWI